MDALQILDPVRPDVQINLVLVNDHLMRLFENVLKAGKTPVDAGDQANSPLTLGEPAPQAQAPQEPLPPQMKLHRAATKHDAINNHGH